MPTCTKAYSASVTTRHLAHEHLAQFGHILRDTRPQIGSGQALKILKRVSQRRENRILSPAVERRLVLISQGREQCPVGHSQVFGNQQ